jgi:endonuclease G
MVERFAASATILRVRFPLVHVSVLLVVGLALPGCLATTAEDVQQADLGAAPSPSPSPPGEGLALSVHTTLGIPEHAVVGDAEHYLLVKPQFVTSFDSHRKNPRWTSWELTSAWLGSTPRSPSFTRDADLPSSIPQADNSDYSGSGFQRGHILPSADRTKSAADNESTFVFTNVVPQTAESNTGTWETLERAERTLTQGGGHVFIIAGSIYADHQTIGAGVAVPTSMFKVVVVLQGARPTPADVTTTTRVISVEIPNTTTVSGDYKHYRTSFGALESKTGFRFLSDVPAAVHDALAAHVDAD